MRRFRGAAVVLLTAVLLLLCFRDSGPELDHSYDEIYLREAVRLEAEDGLFRVLKINDTHLFNGVSEEDRATLSELKIILDQTPCDLIVMGGDLVEGLSLRAGYDKYQAASLFAELIEQHATPWTLAPGNHDGERRGSNRDLIAFLMQYEHFLCGNAAGIDGDMQFFIDITEDGAPVHSIAILDSHARRFGAIGSYDAIRENQIQWLLDGMEERKVKTSVFFHMPTPAFDRACEDGEAYEGFPYNMPYHPSEENRGNKLFDDMTSGNEYLSLVSAGHMHSDNCCFLYRGRYYQLSSASGYGAVRQEEIAPSCTLLTIDTAQTETERIYTFEKRAAG